MERSGRIAVWAALSALVGVCAIGPSAWAETPATASICSRLVAQMRASPATVLKDRTVPKLQPWIVNASSRPAQADPAYRQLPSEWRTMGGDGSSVPTIESLPGTALSMVSAYAGSGVCLYEQFFVRRAGGAIRMVGRRPIGADVCNRAGTWGEFAAVLGVPSFIVYGSLNPNNEDALLIIAPWKGQTWGRACPVSIRFTYRYEVRQLYCGASAQVCAAARQVAPEVRRRYHEWDVSDLDAFNDYGGRGPKFHFGHTPTEQERAWVARVRTLALSKQRMPEPHAWTQHLNRFTSVFFPLRLAGTGYVGVATRTFSGHLPNLRSHWRFIVVRVPKAGARRLVPLAASTVQRVTAAVRSIRARNESVPVNQRESTSIPVS